MSNNMNSLSKKILLLIFTGILVLNIFPTSSTSNKIVPYASPQIEYVTGANFLIIVPEEFADELKPLSLWKSQKGIGTDIITLEEIRATYSGADDAEIIKNCIIDYYENRDTYWVLLAGDHEHIPSRKVLVDEGFSYDGDSVYSDHYYADLDNNWDLDGDHIYGENNEEDEYDFISEVWVGRLSANDKPEMAMLVNRILSYEKSPPVGDWMETAVFAGIIMSYDTDWDGDDVIDLPKADTNRLYNYIANSTISEDWTVHLLAETEGLNSTLYPYTEPLNKVTFRNRLLEGSSVMSMYGHSEPHKTFRHIWTHDNDGDGLFDASGDTMEYYNLINASDNDLVTDSGKYSMAYLAGCSNGNFTEEEDCLAEYLLKTVSIGSIASSQTTWFHDNVSATELEFGAWYSDGLCYRFWEQLQTHNSPGEALALARQDYVEDRAVLGVTEWYPVPIWEEKVLKQFNYFGDPSVEIWMQIPEPIDAAWVENTNSLGYTITVKADYEILPDAIVTLSNESGDVVWSGQTDNTGRVFPELDSPNIGEYLTLTIYKHSYLPLIETIEVPDIIRTVPGCPTLLILIVAFFSVCLIYIRRKRELGVQRS